MCWDKLVIHDVLPHGSNDSTGLLEKALSVPMRVHQMQLLLDSIMLSNPDQVKHSQHNVLIHSFIACNRNTIQLQYKVYGVSVSGSKTIFFQC